MSGFKAETHSSREVDTGFNVNFNKKGDRSIYDRISENAMTLKISRAELVRQMITHCLDEMDAEDAKS